MSKRTIFWLLKAGELLGIVAVLYLGYWVDVWTGGSSQSSLLERIFRGSSLLGLFAVTVMIVGFLVRDAIPEWWNANKEWAERIYNRRKK